MKFTTDEKQTLFGIARGSIAAVFDGQEFELPHAISENLAKPAGVFVTLKLQNDLRGCIGTVMPAEPLYIGVAHNAFHAAFRDPRFLPLSRFEFDTVTLEISVMTCPEQINSFDEIIVGQHGLIVRSGRYAGLLLPQVAVEYGWDRDRFLAFTCMKAGLPADGWRHPDCRVEKFTAEVLSELPESHRDPASH